MNFLFNAQGIDDVTEPEYLKFWNLIFLRMKTAFEFYKCSLVDLHSKLAKM